MAASDRPASAAAAAPAPAAALARGVDPTALARAAQRIATAPEPPWLHREVARRMAERLPLVRLQPRTIVDWGAASGAGGEWLSAAYPRAARIAVEWNDAGREAAARAAAQPWWRTVGRRRPGVVTIERLASSPLGEAQLLWANMALHAAADPLDWMQRWQRALAVDGFLMFTTLGPGTLRRLSALYAEHGFGLPFAPFVDMHDLGDQLVHAGFADPVMDQETLTLTWPDGAAALAELRGLGANAARGRFAGLRTPRWRSRLAQLLQNRLAGADGRVALEFEVVYGHAFKPPPRVKMAAHTEVPVDALRAMARKPRSR